MNGETDSLKVKEIDISANYNKKNPHLFFFFSDTVLILYSYIKPSPAEPGYSLTLQTVQIQITWLLQNLNKLVSVSFRRTNCRQIVNIRLKNIQKNASGYI